MKFESSYEYKLIYIFEIRDEAHKGLLKIGDATIKSDEPIDSLPPNCRALNQSALNRIKQYTNTAGVIPALLHTELAVKTVKDKFGNMCIKAFRDHDVHKILENSNILKEKIKGSTSREWFRVNLNTAVKAIDAVKKGHNNLSNSTRETIRPIIFRPEQEEAITKTLKRFSNGNKMLWNAKMRFGKTLSALEVIKRSNFKKTIIITHRPVVDVGWYEDFTKIFNGMDNYIYGSKGSGYDVEQLEASGKNYIYFASMQDLRGSGTVGGKYDKNNIIFNLNWDFVIIDEAHEGTTTTLGDEVIKNIYKENNGYDTKFLALSGTPFNILRDYDDKSIYTWDYIMEQTQKRIWDNLHFGDSNPYEELPEMKIFTYDIGKLIGKGNYVEFEDKAFNFREFFRVWTGDIEIDKKPMPAGTSIGDFYHEEDVKSFLNLITKDDADSNYPYSSKTYRDLFRHSLWVVPGIKEAKALSKLLKSHPVFGMGFEIVNVAGDGDDDVKSETALKLVQDAIKNAGNRGYTITLSCGKLTTGVTVPEWNSVMMLSGSFSTSASNYLQTIFRVQSPCNKDGKIKTSCYVFDFAPDRTLKMVAESVAISTKAGKTGMDDRKILGEFLNYCPVISIEGTSMKQYNTNNLLQQLKRAYAERAVQNGFDDSTIYNDELLRLDGVALEDFRQLKGIIGSTKASHQTNEIDINRQGFTEEEFEEKERIEKKPLKERSPEELAKLEELKERARNKKDAISILRGISIRMPLLIYGADVPITEDITINQLTDIVDDLSWEEFMPTGVTKEIFNNFTKYYDQEVFISAGRKIRNTAKSADELPPLERVKKISDLFSCFKNPDKETVLTPWRVVNLHLSDCVGGYCFYDDDFKEVLDEPRFIEQPTVTSDIFKKGTKILEINSKTGLYPLYIAYSIFKTKCESYDEKELTDILLEELWTETIEKNIYIVCKTPMAKSITKRTLAGFKPIRVNAHYFDNLINMMINKPEQFIEKVKKYSYWRKEGHGEMDFDAIIGNPPYQIMDGGGTAEMSSKPVYNLFVEQAKKIAPNYVSMIMPARWYSGGKGLDQFRKAMLEDKQIRKLCDFENSNYIFPTVDIAGGVCYFLWKKESDGLCEVINHSSLGVMKSERDLSEHEFFVRNGKALEIVKKIMSKHGITGKYLSDRVSSRQPFGIPTTYKYSEVPTNTPCYFTQKIGVKYVSQKDVVDSYKMLDKWKFLVPKAPIAGQTDFTKPVGFYYNGNVQIAKPGYACSETWLVLGSFKTEEEVKSYKSYILTKIVRFLLLQTVVSQNITKKNFCFIPDLESYTETYTDEKLREMWDITEEEWEYIDSRIHNYDGK